MKILKFLVKAVLFGVAVLVGMKLVGNRKKAPQVRLLPKVSSKSKHNAKSPKPQLSQLSSRQAQIINILRAATTKSADMNHLKGKIKNVTERTLRRDLLALEKLHLLEKKGKTKSARYYLK